jgi:hypothetical protein
MARMRQIQNGDGFFGKLRTEQEPINLRSQIPYGQD